MPKQHGFTVDAPVPFYKKYALYIAVGVLLLLVLMIFVFFGSSSEEKAPLKPDLKASSVPSEPNILPSETLQDQISFKNISKDKLIIPSIVRLIYHVRDTVGPGTHPVSIFYTSAFNQTLEEPFDCQKLNQNLHKEDLKNFSAWDGRILLNTGYDVEYSALLAGTGVTASLAVQDCWMTPVEIGRAEFLDSTNTLYKAIAFAVRKQEDKRFGAYRLYLRSTATEKWSMYDDEEPSSNRKLVPAEEVSNLKSVYTLYQRIDSKNNWK